MPFTLTQTNTRQHNQDVKHVQNKNNISKDISSHGTRQFLVIAHINTSQYRIPAGEGYNIHFKTKARYIPSVRLNQFSSITQNGLSLGALLKFLGRHRAQQHQTISVPSAVTTTGHFITRHQSQRGIGKMYILRFCSCESEWANERENDAHAQFHASNLASARINHSVGARKTKDESRILLRAEDQGRQLLVIHSFREERQHIVALFMQKLSSKKLIKWLHTALYNLIGVLPHFSCPRCALQIQQH
jgi:hypothetical protein